MLVCVCVCEMRALVCSDSGVVLENDVALPDVHASELLVEVKACALMAGIARAGGARVIQNATPGCEVCVCVCVCVCVDWKH